MLERWCDGLVEGSLVAVMAVGFAVIFRSRGFLHAALVDLATVGGVLAVVAAAWLDLASVHAFSTAAWIVLILVISGLACGGLNLAFERTVFRPLEREAAIVPALSSIGLSLVVGGLAFLLLGVEGRSCATMVPREPLLPALLTRPTARDVMVVAVTVVLLTAVWSIRRRLIPPATKATPHRTGDEAARWSFLVGGVLAGVTGASIALTSATIDCTTGPRIGLMALMAACVGGLASVRGAVLGGFVIGFVHGLATALVGDAWAWPLMFAFVLIILVARPAGLLGGLTFRRSASPTAQGRRPFQGEERTSDGDIGHAPGQWSAWPDGPTHGGLLASAWKLPAAIALLIIVPSLFPSTGWIVSGFVVSGLLVAAMVTGAGWVGLLHLGLCGCFSLGWSVTLAVSAPQASSPIVAVAAGTAVATVVGAGFAACTRRLDRHAFAIMAFGFAEAVRLWLEASRHRADTLHAAALAMEGGVERFLTDAVEAANGMTRLPLLAVVVVPMVVVVLLLVWRSGIGLCWTAVREDERAAASLGLSVTRARWYGCALSSAVAGLSGSLQALSGGGDVPSARIWPAVAALVAVLAIAGSGTIRGGIFAAAILAVCGGPWCHVISEETTSGLRAVLGLGLVVAMRLRPGGLFVSGPLLEELRFVRMRAGEVRP